MRPQATRVALAHLGAGDDRREVVFSRLSALLALLRAQYVLYQHLHWQAKGPTYYADHLLFQRLYESVQEQVDQAAEKIVGYVGSAELNAVEQTAAMAEWVARWYSVDNFHRRGLLSEEDCQRVIKEAYTHLKEIDALPLGLDDWLMAAASEHDTNAYLLQQVLAG